MRRGAIVRLVALGLVLGAAAFAVAYFIRWLPVSASKERGGIDFVFWFTTGICIFIFSLVASVIVYSVVKFRAAPDDDSDGPPIHGHTGLEIAWTAVPTGLVVAIAIVSAVVLARNGDAGSSPLRVDVTAQQFAWSFKYPQQANIVSGELRLPLGRKVKLHLRALDVVHSFWVPEFSQKQDAVPGIETTVVISPDKLGTFPVICAELCGLGHAVMRAQAIVMTPEGFDAWARKHAKALAGPSGQAGKAVFESQGCGSCHTLKAAGATGKLGPDLDKLPAEAQQAGKPLEQFVRESIVDPNAYVAPGYSKNVMPQTYAQLPKSQLDALVQYLIQSSKQGGS
jgi:cytochrome c oxidase subunit 2